MENRTGVVDGNSSYVFDGDGNVAFGKLSNQEQEMGGDRNLSDYGAIDNEKTEDLGVVDRFN